MLEAAPEEEVRRQQPLHRRLRSAWSITASTTSRRSCPISRRRKSRAPISAPTPPRSFSTTWRGSRSIAPIPIWSSFWSRSSFATLNWMREQGRALDPDLRPAGVQGRRQVQVLGRADGGSGRRRAGPDRHADARRAASAASASAIGRARSIFSTTAAASKACGCARTARSGNCALPPVVLACGGFEANAEWRTRYLGPGWDLAKVRGSRFNTGDGIRMALDIGASPRGNWSGCHAVQWDMNAPEFGDLAVGDQFQKHSYPFGILVNADGQALRRRRRGFPQLHLRQIWPRGAGAARPVRLADFRSESEAPAARRIQDPPDHQGHGEHDRRVCAKARRRERGRIPQDHQGMERGGAHRHPVQSERQGRALHRKVSPSTKATGRTPSTRRRSRATRSPAASPSPSAACASTTTPQVLNTDYQPIRGLYAAGELVGGLFYFNYPGGTGLMSGAVFGKIAGTSAARGAVA